MAAELQAIPELAVLQARGTELLQLHQDMAAIVPRLTAAVQASQDWQARHESSAQRLRDSQAACAEVQEALEGQSVEVQQLSSLLAAKQKEVERVGACWQSWARGRALQPGACLSTGSQMLGNPAISCFRTWPALRWVSSGAVQVRSLLTEAQEQLQAQEQHRAASSDAAAQLADLTQQHAALKVRLHSACRQALTCAPGKQHLL